MRSKKTGTLSYVFLTAVLLFILASTTSHPAPATAAGETPPPDPITLDSTQPTQWTYLMYSQSGSPPYSQPNLASPALADMNGNGTLDVIAATENGRIVIVEGSSSGIVTTPLMDKDFSFAFGMAPFTQEFASSPAVADIDKDGQPEIVIGAGSTNPADCTRGGVIVIEHDGSVKPGWPKMAVDFSGNGCPDTVYGTPALGDVTGDGYLEIVAGGFDTRVYAWRHDGTPLAGFPADSYLYDRLGWPNLAGQLADTIWGSPVLADLTGNGRVDILLGTDEGNFDDRYPNGTGWVCPYATVPGGSDGYCGGSLYALDGSGSVLSGFPNYILEHIQSTPALADVNLDGYPEIFVGTGTYYNLRSPDHPTHGYRVFGWDRFGNPLPGWANGKSTGGSMPGSPVIGNIAGDDRPEIITLGMDKKLYAWHIDGTAVPGFPMTPRDQQNKTWAYDVGRSPVLGDFDGDGKQEIFLATAWTVTVVDGNGNILTTTDYPSEPAKPMFMAWDTIRNNPAVADIDNDGKLELVVTNYAIHVWELPGSQPDAAWPMFKYDAARTSTIAEPLLALDPTHLSLLVELGESATTTLNLTVRNVGPGAFNWTASAGGRLSVNPTGGSVTRTSPDTVQVTINPAGLGLGTHTVGTVDVTALVDGRHVTNSPASLTVEVIVLNDLHRAFLPAITR